MTLNLHLSRRAYVSVVAIASTAALATGMYCAYDIGKTEGHATGYAAGVAAGKIEGFKEAQSADLVADRCVAFWFRDTRESTRALDRFCKRNEK